MMTAEIMEAKRQERDGVIFSYLSLTEWKAVVDVVAQAGCRVGTVTASLKRLLEAGEVERQWDGNERFGRFVYRRTSHE